MGKPTQVWTEQGESGRYPGWFDCMQSSYLVAMVASGLPPSKFTDGVYTPAERERFEAAEGLPSWHAGAPAGSTEDTGLFNYGRCDTAALALYGFEAHPPQAAALGDLLVRTDVCIALNGIGTGLPVVQKGFVGAHSIAIVPIDASTVWVYDPLARRSDAPRPWDVHAVLTWHEAIAPRDYRYTMFDEYVDPEAPPVHVPKVHTVVAGEWLLGICRAYGVTQGQMIHWNRTRYPSMIKDPGFIRPGWVLQVGP